MIITLKSNAIRSYIQKCVIKLKIKIIFTKLNYIFICGIEENNIKVKNGETKLL